MAICDAQYCFTIVDIGNFGRDNDAQIFNGSEMCRAFISGDMNIPSPTVVKGFNLPHVLVSDEIFGLKTWLMKPYPGKGLNEEKRIFNYRLSRAHRTIENSFGIFAARWRIFRQPTKANPATVDSIIKACIGLHNLQTMQDIHQQDSLTRRTHQEMFLLGIGVPLFKENKEPFKIHQLAVHSTALHYMQKTLVTPLGNFLTAQKDH